jgi:hypothetical protein
MSIMRLVSNSGRSAILCTLLAAAVILCGCTVARLSHDDSDGAEDPRNPQPANYRSDILAMLRIYLNNPTEIKDASIAAPALMRIGTRDRYGICLRLNARKISGEYTGSKDYVAIFVAGRLDQLVDAKREQCLAADYQPFPEAEKVAR